MLLREIMMLQNLNFRKIVVANILNSAQSYLKFSTLRTAMLPKDVIKKEKIFFFFIYKKKNLLIFIALLYIFTIMAAE